jgi:hypothetical protein
MARVDPSGIVFAVGNVLTSKRQIIPLGTAWSFHQTTAPTGWAKVTTHNDKALRVVGPGNGGGSGGSISFTSALRNPFPLVASGTCSLPTNTNNHILSISEISQHTHGFPGVFNAGGSGDVRNAAGWSRNSTPSTGSSGGGQGHNHPVSGPNVITNQSLGEINLEVRYIDTIICTFDG